MKLDEAIKHCEEKACGNTECDKEHKQLAEWLRKLQRYEKALTDIVNHPKDSLDSYSDDYIDLIGIADEALKE